MTKIKEQALNKLLEEVNNSNNDAIDKIHNWISDQNDTELFTGILQKDKSIAEALSYCASKVKRSGNYGIATDENRVVQCRGKHNKIAPDEVMNTVEKWVNHARQKLENRGNIMLEDA